MSITFEKSRKFAIRIYNLYTYLCEKKHEYVLSKQLLRSGTSIGANLAEAKYSISRNEYKAKTKISLKECAETEYWINLLNDVNLLNQDEYSGIINDCKELLRLLIATINTLNREQATDNN